MIRPRDACVFLLNKAHREAAGRCDSGEPACGGEAKLELLLLVEQADEQKVVPELAMEPSVVLGDGTKGAGDMQRNHPTGAAFTALILTARIPNKWDIGFKISNIRWALVYKFGEGVHSLRSERGVTEGKFAGPCGVALLQSNGGQQETVLVVEEEIHRV